MTEDEMLKKVQAFADEKAKNYISPAQLILIHHETLENGNEEVLTLGSDMPLLVYRVFEIDKDGNVSENPDIKYAVERTRHYNEQVRPTLKLVPPAIEEANEYAIVVENPIKDGGVEVKLKSTVGRDMTMIEVFRYFDYVSRIFFVSCIATSFGGSYLFSVTPDSKHLRLILGNQPEVRKRVEMINELLRNNLLPSYRTIADGARFLGNQAKAQISLKDPQGNNTDFESTICYDDPKTQTRFAFFAKKGDQSQGVVLIDDIFDGNKLRLGNQWTPEEKDAFASIQKLMQENRDEFNKHVVMSFFADDLDFRYQAFKDGKLHREAPQAAAPAKAEEAPQAETEEKPAENVSNQTVDNK